VNQFWCPGDGTRSSIKNEQQTKLRKRVAVAKLKFRMNKRGINSNSSIMIETAPNSSNFTNKRE
jgi:hypothetical protein